MGAAGYIFTGEHDANVMHNSAAVNLNVTKKAASKGIKKLFYSLSYQHVSQNDLIGANNQIVKKATLIQQTLIQDIVEKLFSEHYLYRGLIERTNYM
jgi:GDP-D-mannose 3', 5'-epimerase